MDDNYGIPEAQGYYRFDVGKGWVPDVSVLIETKPVSGLVFLRRSLLYVDDHGQGTLVPEGLLYDGGSKPRATWPIVGHPLNPQTLPAYTVHDYDCDEIDDMYKRGRISRQTAAAMRKDADVKFLEALRWLSRHFAGIRREDEKSRTWRMWFRRLGDAGGLLLANAKYAAVRLQACWVWLVKERF